MYGKEIALRKAKLKTFIDTTLPYSVVAKPGNVWEVEELVQNKSSPQTVVPPAKVPTKAPQVAPPSTKVVKKVDNGLVKAEIDARLPVSKAAKKATRAARGGSGHEGQQDMHLSSLANEFTMLSLHPDASTHHPGKRTLSSCMFERRSQKADKAEPYHLLTDGYSLTGSCGLLGERHSDDVPSSWDDEVVSEEDCVYLNTEAPFCAICIGVQGAGKSHTMNVMLENCLLPHTSDDVDRPIINTRQPMAGLVLHFDQSQSNVCEAVGLNEPAHWLRWPDGACPPKMVVLVSPTFYHQRKLFYAGVDVEVLPLLFDWSTITATQLRKLMRLCDTDAQLYVSTMLSTLRDYQRNSKIPRFDVFLEETVEKCNANGQSAPLQQVYSANALNAVLS
jgi:hypothetical protein